MEKLDKELEKLRADMNKRIDDIKAKIEKPAFEIGKWNKFKENGLIFVEEVVDKFNLSAYGFSDVGKWYDSGSNFGTACFSGLATPQEVQAELEKEAVKRGFKIGCRVKGFRDGWGPHLIEDEGNGFELYANNSMFSLNDVCVFDNGTWATPIKTMSIRELAQNLNVSSNVLKYLTENKTEIIETLNSL